MTNLKEEPQSIFIKNTLFFDNFSPELMPEELKRYLISSNVISDYLSLLRQSRTELIAQFKDEFIRSVMIPDFNQVIINLKEYRGKGRTRVVEARKYVQEALSNL